VFSRNANRLTLRIQTCSQILCASSPTQKNRHWVQSVIACTFYLEILRPSRDHFAVPGATDTPRSRLRAPPLARWAIRSRPASGSSPTAVLEGHFSSRTSSRGVFDLDAQRLKERLRPVQFAVSRQRLSFFASAVRSNCRAWPKDAPAETITLTKWLSEILSTNDSETAWQRAPLYHHAQHTAAT
jgi:hypothetical protein